MTTDEMRIAIAEHLGWKVFHGGKYVQPKGERFRNLIVDPLEDLNAMHSAEEALPPDLRFEYHNHIFNLVPSDENHGPVEEGGEDMILPSGFSLLHATALQRAEAFLRCVGKWKEDL